MTKKTFAIQLIFAATSFVSCNVDESNNQVENIPEEVVIFDDSEYNYKLTYHQEPVISRSSSYDQEEYSLTISPLENPNTELTAILIKENIECNRYILYHYSIEKELIARIYIKDDNIIENVILEPMDILNGSRAKGDSWYNCLNKEYTKFKNYYNNNHPIICGAADIFFGACTVSGILVGAYECSF